MIKKISLTYKTSQYPDGGQSVAFHLGDMASEGEVTCTYPDGSGYRGSFKDDRFHGVGAFVWSDGSRYEGQMKNGLPHGTGTILLSDGYRYEGEWQNGVADGEGVETMPDGGRYKG